MAFGVLYLSFLFKLCPVTFHLCVALNMIGNFAHAPALFRDCPSVLTTWAAFIDENLISEDIVIQV